MTELSLQLVCGVVLRLVDTTAVQMANLPRLAQLMGITSRISNNIEPDNSLDDLDNVVVFLDEVPQNFEAEKFLQRRAGDWYFNERTKQFYCVAKNPSAPYTTDRMQLGLMMAATSAMLRGIMILPTHGSLLNIVGGVIWLSGCSGMGKSTTACRWTKLGHTIPSDDLFWMEFYQNKFYAHPMPTWSRCRPVLSEEVFPFEPVLPIVHSIALSRAEENQPERLTVSSEPEYIMTIFSACCFASGIYKLLPEQLHYLAEVAKKIACLVIDHHDHRILYAHLDANLEKTLKDGNIVF